MCFSAQASFIASGFLLFIAILSIKINKKENLKVLSLMPLLFSIQQFFEGILWLTLESNIFPLIQTASKIIFLIFAILIWPMYVTYSIKKFETKDFRESILKLLYKLSIVWTIIATIYMVIFQAEAEICTGHISYGIQIGGLLAGIATISYLVFTILPFFISSNKKLWVFGILIAITAAIAYTFYNSYFTSVWCYFAAIASSTMLIIIKIENNKNNINSKNQKQNHLKK